MKNPPPWLRSLASLRLAVVSLSALMAVVLLCTFDQVRLGTWGAVDQDIRSFLVWRELGGLRVPVFPGGGLVGAVLFVNLLAAFLVRFRWERRKAGIWLAHTGLVLLVGGEFLTAGLAQEDRLPIREGETKGWVESHREVELAVVETTAAGSDTVHSFPRELFEAGGELSSEGLPFSLLVKRVYPNSVLADAEGPGEGALADRGVGPRVRVRPARPTYADDETNTVSAFVELASGDVGLGTWLLSTGISVPQGFTHQGRSFELALRPTRTYLPYTLTLKDFKHDLYPGTEIPKNFSSLVRLVHPGRGEDRDALIYMNNPLRYEGRTFYQASFGEGDTLSVLQVVRNPGWLVPYVACAMVGLGLLVQFGLHLWGFAPAGEEPKVRPPEARVSADRRKEAVA